MKSQGIFGTDNHQKNQSTLAILFMENNQYASITVTPNSAKPCNYFEQVTANIWLNNL